MHTQKNLIKKKTVRLLLTAVIVLGCICFVLVIGNCERISNREIKKSWWKYGSGYNIGGALRFEETNLKGDTIYSNDKPIALIVSCGKGFFRTTAILEIEDLKTGVKGIYHDKGPR